jgi:hypothetical protein
MPLGRLALAGGVLVAALAGPASAQVPGEDRFFFVAERSEEEQEETAFDGSLTSTTFFYTEAGGEGDPYGGIGQPPQNASVVDRIFTDLRAQLDAKHIRGSKLDFRADVRGRLTATGPTLPSNDGIEDPVPFQSGTFHGDEVEIRELYVKRDGGEFDWWVGRQFSLELAAFRFDGLKVERQNSERWKTIGFAGTYPTRGSRDIRDDYPVGDNDPDPAVIQPKRIVPVTGGVGAAYRYERLYGAFGLVGIAPLATDQATGTLERPRVFLTSNGYWRQSSELDLFHYAVLDAMGASGAGITNLTLGASWQPVQALRAYANLSRVDTETLNVQAQTRLEDPDANEAGIIQNNIAVSRIAQDAARVGVSASLQNRFEISTSGALRRRPELAVPVSGAMDVVFPASQAADITIAAVDRRSWKDLRIGLSGTRTFGVGDVNLYRSRSLIVRADVSRAILDGKAEVEGNLMYLGSQDDNIGTTCMPGAPINDCYGAASMTSVSLGGLLFYRFRPAWFAVGSANLGRQLLTTTIVDEQTVAQRPITVASLFLRLAYRF